MSKNIIDKLVADKLQGLNFDFKAEYWDKMHEQLNADCAQNNTCNYSGISGFLSGSLLVAFFSFISIIIFFPWGINNSNAPISTETSLIEESIILNPTISTTAAQETLEYSEVIIKQETINTTPKKSKVVVKTKSKKHRSRKSHTIKQHSTTNMSTTAVSPKVVDEKTIVSTEVITAEIPNDSLTTSNQNFVETKSVNKAPIEQTTIESENDSVIINDGKILDSQKEVKENNNQVVVQAKPTPVKHVKTRRKPNKRVFKKRKGILYRLGLRK